MVTVLDFAVVVVIAVTFAIAALIFLHKGAEQGRRADQAEAKAKAYKRERDALEDYYNVTESFIDDLGEEYEGYTEVFSRHKDYVDAKIKVDTLCFQ